MFLCVQGEYGYIPLPKLEVAIRLCGQQVAVEPHSWFTASLATQMGFVLSVG